MPTSAPSLNPWLRIYLPLALQKPTTAAKKCLLYAILSVAAFNKAELADGDRAQVQRQAGEYKDRAASMLRQCLADLRQRLPNQANDQGDATDSQALLAAGLTMTTVEIFSGATEGKGYEHIQLCKQIVRHTGGLSWWLSDTSSATLVQIFRCLDIVAHTSGWRFLQEAQQDMFEGDESSAVGIDALSSPSSGNDTPEADPMGPVFALAPKYTLDVTFGVSMKTLACLDRIVALSKAKAGFAAGEGWSTAHVDQLINLEADIFDTLEDPEALSNPSDAAAVGLQEGISSYVSQEIKHNHVWAFHYSSAVFYRRALCDGGATVQPLAPVSATVRERWEQRPSGQALVSKALEYLENVDALSSDIAIANTLWPGFIAAIEASDMPLRHRALIWFTRAKRHGIGNIVKAKDLVMEVWRRVDRQTWVNPTRKNLESELSHTDWRQVMRDTGMYIMLT
ncbi:hypothetical protein GQ53DRAFT_865866 [Thozetella sp. PMI_491]|nr:hypothetical protein GQ53DRAFT_865866 [Thozetella sp. PMI_491]